MLVDSGDGLSDTTVVPFGPTAGSSCVPPGNTPTSTATPTGPVPVTDRGPTAPTPVGLASTGVGGVGTAVLLTATGVIALLLARRGRSR